MDSVLVVSSVKNSHQALLGLLNTHKFLVLKQALSGSEARRLLIDNDFDLIVINSPLQDEFGHELALDASNNNSGVLLIVKSELSDEVSSKVEDYGVYVIEKPINKQIFFQSLKLISATQARLKGLKKENSKLQVKIEEIKLIDRAKCALIQYLNLSESQAHRYIEKQAMDLRKSKHEVASDILKTYND